MPKYLSKSLGKPPIQLFDATGAGSTLLKLLCPAAGPTGFTWSLNTPASGLPANIVNSTPAVCGGVIPPFPLWDSVLLDFAAVGAADRSLAIEIGRFPVVGAMAQILATATLKSITTSGTIANVNPYTGVATPGITWRLFDLITLTNKGQLGQVLVSVGGAEDNTPAQLILNVSEMQYYYVMITSLDQLTEVSCVMTPQ